MAAIEPLCRLIGVDPSRLSKEEYLILEAELFYSICEHWKDIFRSVHKEYFRLTKFTTEKETVMLEENFFRFFINDILATKAYTLEGIAYCANTHLDILHEIILGRNSNPSSSLLLKIIELHRSLRSDLYKAIIKKIIEKYWIVE